MEEEEFQTTLDVQIKLDKSGLVRFYLEEKLEGFLGDRSRTIKESNSEGTANPKDFLKLLEHKILGVKFPQNDTN